MAEWLYHHKCLPCNYSIINNKTDHLACFCTSFHQCTCNRYIPPKNRIRFWRYRSYLRMCYSVHYCDVIMGAIASQVTSLTNVYSTVYSDAKKTSKLSVTGLCAGNSPGAGEFPAEMASYAENVSIWWRHHVVVKGDYLVQFDDNPGNNKCL